MSNKADHRFLTLLAICLVVLGTASAATLYWDGNASTAKPVNPFPAALQDAKVELSKMADGQTESFILGNGDLYGIVWEKDGALQLRITKNDIWDARVDTANDAPLPKVNIRTREVTGATGAPPSFAKPFPQPLCGATLRISGTSPVVGGVLDLQHALATMVSGNGDKTGVRVLADRNVVLIDTKAAVSIDTGRGGNSGTTDGVEWQHVTLPGDMDYKGMEYCVAVGGTANVKMVSLVTSFDEITGDVRSAAIALVRKTVADMVQSPEQLQAGHEKVWKDFWARSGVELADRDLQRWWYRMMYFARTVSQPGGRFPVGLMPPLATDITPWHADYHFNYNSWQPFWSVISANHSDLADPWVAYLNRLLPRAQWQAREVFGCDGVYYSISQFLHEPDPAACQSVNKRSVLMNPWGMTIGMVGMTAENLWHKHLCDPDRRKSNLFSLPFWMPPPNPLQAVKCSPTGSASPDWNYSPHTTSPRASLPAPITCSTRTGGTVRSAHQRSSRSSFPTEPVRNPPSQNSSKLRKCSTRTRVVFQNT